MITGFCNNERIQNMLSLVKTVTLDSSNKVS